MWHEVVIISGLDRSGKSTVAEIFAEAGYRVIECGEVARTILGMGRGRELSKAYEAKMALVNGEILKIILNAFAESRLVVVVGVRSNALFANIRSAFPSVYTIFVSATLAERYARYVASVRTAARMDVAEFVENDAVQYRWGLGELRELCDIFISNSGAFGDVRRRILNECF